jgi:hypothetical protein
MSSSIFLQRLKVARTMAKSTGYVDNSAKVYEKQEKAVKLEGSSAPQPLVKWNRQPLGGLDALIAGK